MKRLSAIALLALLLFPVLLHAEDMQLARMSVGVMGGSVAAGGCGTQSTMVTQTTNNASSTEVYGANVVGQSFLADGGQVYSITINVSNMNGGAGGTLRLLLDSDSSLSDAVYYKDLSVTATGNYEFIFTTPVQTTSATWYFAVQAQGFYYANRINLGGSSTSTYADGVEYFGASLDGMSTIPEADLYFTVKKCGS